MKYKPVTMPKNIKIYSKVYFSVKDNSNIIQSTCDGTKLFESIVIVYSMRQRPFHIREESCPKNEDFGSSPQSNFQTDVSLNWF